MDEKIRLVLETLGADNVRQAVKALREMESAVDDIDESIRSGVIDSTGEFWLTLKDGQKVLANTAEGFRRLIDDEGRFLITLKDGRRIWNDSADGIRATNEALAQYQKAAKTASTQTDELADEMDQLGRSIREGVEVPMERFLVKLKDGRKVWNDSAEGMRHLGVVAGRDGKFGSSMLQAAFFVDDLQYGLRGIVNNIPQMVQAFGGGALAAGAIGIAMVGVNQAVQWFNAATEDKTKKNLKDLATGHEEASVAVRKHEESLKKLEETTPKVAAEYAKYIDTIDRLKKAKEELAAADEAERLAAADAKKESEDENKAKSGLATVYDDLINKTGQSGKFQESLQNEIINKALTDRQAKIDEAIRTPSKIVRENGMNVIKPTDPEFQLAKDAIRGQGMNFMLGDAQLNELARNEVLAKTRGNATLDSRAEVNKLVRDVQGKGSKAEQDQAFARLQELAPEVAAQLGETLQFDNQNASFDAGNERWRKFGGARRRAREAEFAAGERTGAAMLPNRGTMEDAQNADLAKDNFAREAAEKARRDIMSGLSGVLPDPETLAAMRRGNAGIGVGAVQRMRNLESMDQNALFSTFRNAGMNEGDARRSVAEYMQQGNEAFSEFAQANGMNSRSLSEGFRASQQLLQKIMQDQQEVQEVIQWMQNAMNVQQNAGGNVRPQMGRARN